jgi:hypothetical protein
MTFTSCTTRFNINILCSAHTVYLCALYVHVSQYKEWLFPIRHKLTGSIPDMGSVYWVVWTGYLNRTDYILSL